MRSGSMPGGAGSNMPYLEIKLGPDTMLLRFVGRIDYVFGRLPRADVQLRDMKVSRLHTQFFIDSRGGAFVRDLGSSGGTWINNQRLRRGVIAPLTEGLKLRIGDAKITFYDQEPPVNAVEPPGRSDPRGLIRTNPRERYFEAEATVLAMDKVDPDTQSGPAEAPPEINPADFADSPGDLSGQKKASKPPVQKPPEKKKKRTTGIVEAPWEKKEPGPVAPDLDQRVSIPQSTRGGQGAPSPPMETAAIDEEGNYADAQPPAAPEPPPADIAPPPPPQVQSPEELEGKVEASPAQEAPADDGLDATGRTSREPVVEDAPAFKPPPPIAGDLPAEEESEPAPRVGMPTVRLERPNLEERQKQIEEDEAEERAALKIPTASVEPGAEVEDEPEPEPQIGTAPSHDTPVAKDDEEEELTDEEIAEYLGGSASGRFGDVDFGDGEKEEDSDEGEEVSFGEAAKVGMADEETDIDLDDDEPESEPAAEAQDEVPEKPADEPAEVEEEPTEEKPIKEASTSMLGASTAISEDAVEEAEASEEPVAETQEKPEPETAAEEPPEVPAIEDKKTPPPSTREGATEGRTFKPKKTRKLMKRKRETGKITDKSNPTPPPSGAKTSLVMDKPIAEGAKTLFIPKPDDAKLSRSTADGPPQPEKPTGKPKRLGENREQKDISELGDGPGGDTVALPPAMMKKLQEELSGKKKEESPTIGDNPTVKVPDREDEEEEDFILDEDYAFFTPPPATKKAREAAAKAAKGESDVINANDFHSETDNLPQNKKAASTDDPDTLVD